MVKTMMITLMVHTPRANPYRQTHMFAQIASPKESTPAASYTLLAAHWQETAAVWTNPSVPAHVQAMNPHLKSTTYDVKDLYSGNLRVKDFRGLLCLNQTKYVE